MKKLIIRAIVGIAIVYSPGSYGNSINKSTEAKDTTTKEATLPQTEQALQPHGYLVANYSINDKAAYKKYMHSVGVFISKYKGKVIIYDVNIKPLEGNPQKVIDITEFPSIAEAERFYNSPEYTAAKKLRTSSTQGWVLLAGSVPPSPVAATSTPQKIAKPHGYQIVNYTINDQATFQKYMDAAGPLGPKFNGSVPIFDLNTKALEGNPKKVFGIAAFPSVAEAERFYHSPEYTAARKFRIASTEGTTLIASSVPPQQ
ncbi:Uncharacterized conserved protein, DUF1330 family [Chitinophaga sp. CF118]|uniref:DUF1330 domain-containing protein n=1 Tax=Chitinophaga sp. CF118 TaxID=1884367 RepID=UPI0008E89D0D|nr:DUF1330 domain-containing protein [Chitinophaga sp. CF118]SFD08802.1 Uncharacterized conserved protein, DUF1330 family [Chitinophaga sp. CF118]